MRQSEKVMNAAAQVMQHFPKLEGEAFVCNLLFMYHVIAASENLTRQAAERAEGSLKDYFTQHLAEETGHEQWLAEDLLTAGIDVKKTAVAIEAVEMAGSQYYLINHVHPVALLGYMVVLECVPMPLERVEELEAAHGKELLRTLRYHAEHDIDHGADVLAVIDTLTDEQINLVTQSAVQTAHYALKALQRFAK